MASITINEISANYGYSVGTNSFATVAMPITAQWGPGFFASTDELLNIGNDDNAESKYCNYMSNVKWDTYTASTEGMESFLRSYRGPTANFKSAQDYSYHQALTLLNAGYDVLVCRVSPGEKAKQTYDIFEYVDVTTKKEIDSTTIKYGSISISAKYPGTFGNNLYIEFKKKNRSSSIFNIIIYTKDASGVKSNLENILCTFSEDEATDSIPYYKEVESAFIYGIQLNNVVIDNETYIGIVNRKETLVTVDKTTTVEPVYTIINSPLNGGTDREVSTYDAVLDSLESGKLTISSKIYSTQSDTENKKTAKSYKLSEGDSIIIRLYGNNITSYSGTLTSLTIKDTAKKNVNYDAIPIEKNPDVKDDGSITKIVKDAIVTLRYTNINEPKFCIEANKTPQQIGLDIMRLAHARYGGSCSPSNQEGYEFDPQNSAFWSKSGGDIETIDESDTKTVRYLAEIHRNVGKPNYEDGTWSIGSSTPTWAIDKLSTVLYREWLYTAVVGTTYYDSSADNDSSNFDTGVYALLKDKLKYNAQRVISPGWDDQDILFLDDILYIADAEALNTDPIGFNFISPIHVRLMDIGYWARCTAALLDIPRSISRCKVFIESENNIQVGYAQKLARNAIYGEVFDVGTSDVGLYPTHSALFAPWGQYKYVRTSKMNMASPAFLALLIHRSQLKNQADQYEWVLPKNRVHTLNIGKMDYTVPKKLMDLWQGESGVGVNIITEIPGLGINIWGNSTLYEVPEATYQALANLSTRYLVDAIENVAYNVGISITFTYNNNQAYEQFYTGVTPLMDSMKNIGAITDYYVRMEADINGLDRVNANTVLGKIYITPVGVINDIVVDLVALPPTADLTDIRVS